MITMRFVLFLLFCIPSRIAISYIVRMTPKKWLPLVGTIALISAIAFAFLYFTGVRTSGFETFGKPIWWNELRIVHSMLYMLTALYAFQRKQHAWIPLFVDAWLGLISFTLYHLGVVKFI